MLKVQGKSVFEAGSPGSIAAAHALAPTLRHYAEANEQAGRLTNEVMGLLQEAGLFGLLAARSVGGLEAEPVVALEVYEALSEADAAAGWVVMACNVSIGSASGYLPDAGAREVFGAGVPIIAGNGGPFGRADVDGEGFRLSGQWSYGSGVLHASWIHSGARVFENGKPRIDPRTGQPEVRTFIVPAAKAKLLGNWDVVGLRATGSVDYEMTDVFVPEAFTHSPDANMPERGGGLYRLGIVGMAPLGHTAVALGVARRALSELADLADSSGGRPSRLMIQGGDAPFQESFGLAEAQLRAARSLCYEVWQDISDTVGSGEAVSTRQYTLARLSLIHATNVAADICTFSHKTAGGVSLRNTALQRCFRDMFAATQHRLVSNFFARDCAQDLLGLAENKVWAIRGLVDRPAGAAPL
ncbi:acyl-CoA dehydrogenase family protein [Bosea sp. (in: a-proteobacteria)]|uniref:acyl-CoA dehydrogenase family protein n=1 Tax=Bosea sp. (in: a-proteobacteria) TaxID=1871050 RepID=UPI003B3B5953